MKTFENFLITYQLHNSSFLLNTREEVAQFIENNSLSKILDFWKFFPEGMIEKEFKEEMLSKSLKDSSNDDDDESYYIHQKYIYHLLNHEDAWFIAENLLQNEIFEQTFEYFYQQIFFDFQDSLIN